METLELGMVGLGRMGAGLTRRLLADGHRVVVHDTNETAVESLVEAGAVGASSPGGLVAALTPPRTVWIMVPATITGSVIDAVAGHLGSGDTIIDGGNSFYAHDLERGAALTDRGIHFIDIGTSGGVLGEERGYCLMIGGDDEPVGRLDPLFRTLAPGVSSAPRTAGRDGEPHQAEHGYLHCGPVGAGHFVKMVHNGIEYALMAAYAEGLNLLAHAGTGGDEREADAGTAPLDHPDRYRFDIDLGAVAEVWRRGSVVSSWLLDLTAAALAADPDLDQFTGHVSDSGEGRWTAKAAVDLGVPAQVMTTALFQRFESRDEAAVAYRLLSAMRKQFGGHEERGAP
jgi:6-phosphogluconate dehydrogenase